MQSVPSLARYTSETLRTLLACRQHYQGQRRQQVLCQSPLLVASPQIMQQSSPAFSGPWLLWRVPSAFGLFDGAAEYVPVQQRRAHDHLAFGTISGIQAHVQEFLLKRSLQVELLRHRQYPRMLYRYPDPGKLHRPRWLALSQYLRTWGCRPLFPPAFPPKNLCGY